MITIDFSTLERRKAQAAAEKKQVTYIIGSKRIRSKLTKEETALVDTDLEAGLDLDQQVRDMAPATDGLEQQLWQEFNSLKVERNKLSSQIWKMVENGATQGELAVHYESIESHRPGMMALYDKIQHVRQYGALPAPPAPTPDNVDPYYLKDRKSRLVDKRCKLRRKLNNGKSSTPAKMLEWEQELAQADLEYREVEEKLKQIEGKA